VTTSTGTRRWYGRDMRSAVGPLVAAAVSVLVAGCGDEQGGGAGAPSLQGTPWVLSGGIDVEGWERFAPSLTFGPERFGGFTGCNQYGGAYTVDGITLELGEIAMTLIGCPPPAGDVERELLAALGRVAEWRVDGAQLVLAGADGTELLRFDVASPIGSWSATDGGELESLVTGVHITATFTEDAQLRGGAGCNTYRTTYAIDGSAIEISPPASTKKFCAEPEGVMEQEMRYLAALAGAERFRVDGNVLRLTRADGSPVVSFARRDS
jgi:heat shock protein HslJ